MPRRFRYIILGIYWLALAIGSHWPQLDIARQVGLSGNDAVFLGLDKWLHVSAFAGLTTLILWARLIGGSTRRHVLGGAALALLYAGVDEITQLFVPGRSVLLSDFVASAIGVALGAAAYLLVMWALGDRLRKSEIREPKSEIKADFVGHARVVAGLTLLSRVFGLVRDWSLAFALGFGGVMDAFVIAFMIPNLFRRLFGEGALAGAFIPQFAQLHEQRPTSARLFARRILKWMLLGLGTLAGLTCIGLVAWVALFRGTLDERGVLTASLTAVTIWYMPLVCVTAILGAMLQTYKRFGVPAAAPVILNLCIICSALGLYFLGAGDDPASARRIVWGVAIAVIVAGVIQAAWSVAACRKAESKGTKAARHEGTKGAEPRGNAETSDQSEIHTATRGLLRQWGPTTLGLAVLQLNTLADALIAMFFSGEPGQSLELFGRTLAYPMDVGAVAVLGATARLYEFPLGVFGIAVATAIFPALSAAAKSDQRFTDLVHRGIRLTIFIGLPATAGLLLVREPLARAIYFEAGRLESDDALRVANVLLGYATAVWAYSLNHLLVRAFYAKQQATTPMKVSLAMVALNVTLNLTLIWPLGVAGLAWSTAICATLQCYILLRLVRRYVPTPIDRTVAGSLAKTGLITLVMAAAVWATDALLPHPDARIHVILQLALLVAVGGITALILARLLNMPELRWILSRSAARDVID